jgi:hypothetical protein
MIELQSSEQKGAWERLLEHLQIEGMSSEGEDEGYQVYPVKWRHPESIDDTKPVERIRDGTLISSPQGFHDSGMRQTANNMSLRVSEEPFPW